MRRTHRHAQCSIHTWQDTASFSFAERLRALRTGGWILDDDLNRFLRLADQERFSERLISWFEKTGLSNEVAPLLNGKERSLTALS